MIKKTTIRPALQADYKALVNANIQLALETENLALDKQLVEDGVLAVFQDPSKGRYIIIEEDNQVIASLMITHEWSDWRNNNVAWIQSVYVAPTHRRLGYFTQLFQFVENLCKQGQYCGIRLYADKTNLAAIAMYRKIGLDDSHYLFFEKMNS